LLLDHGSALLDVAIQQVQRAYGGGRVFQGAIVRSARGADPRCDGAQEGSCPAGRLDELYLTEILVGCVSDEIEDEVDHSAAREDLAVLHSLRGDSGKDAEVGAGEYWSGHVSTLLGGGFEPGTSFTNE
jgi:hypothetical protein